jgi:hypothetical protein
VKTVKEPKPKIMCHEIEPNTLIEKKKRKLIKMWENIS